MGDDTLEFHFHELYLLEVAVHERHKIEEVISIRTVKLQLSSDRVAFRIRVQRNDPSTFRPQHEICARSCIVQQLIGWKCNRCRDPRNMPITVNVDSCEHYLLPIQLPF